MFKPGLDDAGVHGVRPGGADAVPVRRGAGPAARGVRRRGLRAARRRRDGAGHRPPTSSCTSATSPTGRGTPSRSTTSSTSTTCGPGRSRPGSARPRRCPHERPARPRRPPAYGAARVARPPPARRSSLDSINIADISRRAGVTRSAFYFYFENKASAVAALMEEMYDESFAAADLLRGDGTPGREHRGHGPRAVLDVGQARAPVPRLARRPRDQHHRARALGQRPGVVRPGGRGDDRGPSAPRAPRRPAPTPPRWPACCSSSTTGCWSGSPSAGPLDREQLVEAVVAIWLHTIYGEVRR